MVRIDTAKLNMEPLNYLGKIEREIVSWRRRLHMIPETGFNEHETTLFLSGTLEKRGIKVHRRRGRTGLIAEISNGAGGCIALRADIDGLPIAEKNAFAHRSRHPGFMHACGHEGHSAMLLAAAGYLQETRRFRGRVLCVFQPAEETFEGAAKMMGYPVFRKARPSRVFGMHNLPELPQGRILVSPGCAMAASDFFDLVIKGKGTHGATPQYGINPFRLFSLFYTHLEDLVRRYDRRARTVVSITSVIGGKAYNVIPDEISVKGTIRTLDAGLRLRLLSDIRRLLKSTVSANRGSFMFTIRDNSCPATVNHPGFTKLVQKCAEGIFGTGNVITKPKPTMGSDDVALFLRKIPGAYVMIGSGTAAATVPWHNPRYDFNDKILVNGAALLASVTESYLASKR